VGVSPARLSPVFQCLQFDAQDRGLNLV
jgi:hypothetical protein